MKSSGEDQGRRMRESQPGQARMQDDTFPSCKHSMESDSAVCFGKGFEIWRREDGCIFAVIKKIHVI